MGDRAAASGLDAALRAERRGQIKPSDLLIFPQKYRESRRRRQFMCSIRAMRQLLGLSVGVLCLWGHNDNSLAQIVRTPK
jgi:hypothetical protein